MDADLRRLKFVFGMLSVADRMAVVSFAEYLYDRERSGAMKSIPEPICTIARPVDEKVPAALKRLRLTYPMLDASGLLAEASDLLSEHLMFGRSAVDVIDAMEGLFRGRYEVYCREIAAT